MEESIKDRFILVLGILTLILLMGTVGSCSNAHRLKLARDKEMVIRLDLEERMNKFSQEKMTLENKLNSLAQELVKEKEILQATKNALEQEQLVSQSLKEEIQKITRLKDAIEEDLKEALPKGKSRKTKD
ncbi:MAG: hypothetical protein KKH29_01530 [Candidatus Omnitrophica bacterium]|nr:hypothetical protein [Candidatus Omnitrophota bacterium]MBU4345993.1 hypothetical protein [Candidatus Omnitrophota bacterium]MBU4472829.1 hypothetical protein [Candidatus Omnitrophota bacterium]MCG2706022.1 hypothetical protein [Candidatus Omnitrophota bacterium]